MFLSHQFSSNFLCWMVLLALFGVEETRAGSYNSKFVLIKENATLKNVEPIYQANVTSKLECLLFCQQKDCFIISIIDSGAIWICSLFHYIENLSSKLLPKDTTDVSAEVFQIDLQVEDECLDWLQKGFKENGVYWIGIEGMKIFQVFCDMSMEGGGWTLFQKRRDGSVNFNQNWNAYKFGFGDAEGEYWLGNEWINKFTKRALNQLLLYGKKFDGGDNFEMYDGFAVGNESTNYQLTSGNYIAGNKQSSQDWLHHDDKRFSTSDNSAGTNCAHGYRSGWWFDRCLQINLNFGTYSLDGSVSKAAKGLVWLHFNGFFNSLKETKMMMRRRKKDK